MQDRTPKPWARSRSRKNRLIRLGLAAYQVKNVRYGSKADIQRVTEFVRYVPIADIGALRSMATPG